MSGTSGHPAVLNLSPLEWQTLSCAEPPFGDPGKEQLCGKAWFGSPSLLFSSSICFYSTFYFEGKKGPPVETLLDITMNFHISVTRFTYCQHLAGFAPLLLLPHGQIIVIIACFFIFAELVKSTPWDVFVFVPEDVSTVSSEEGHSPTQPPCHCASVTVHIQILPCVPTMCFMVFYLPIRLRPGIMNHICFHVEHSSASPFLSVHLHFGRVQT